MRQRCLNMRKWGQRETVFEGIIMKRKSKRLKLRWCNLTLGEKVFAVSLWYTFIMVLIGLATGSI